MMLPTRIVTITLTFDDMFTLLMIAIRTLSNALNLQSVEGY